MEEGLETEVFNETNYIHIDYNAYSIVHHVFLIGYSLIEIVSDSLIIYTVATNHVLRTKTNVILMNWAISDVLFLVNLPIFLLCIFYLDMELSCAYVSTVHFIDVSVLLIFILLLQPIIKEDRFSMFAILITLYSIGGVIVATFNVLCVLDIDYQLYSEVHKWLFILLLATIVAFEFVTYFQKHRTFVDANFIHRFNICRIYTYNHVFVTLNFFVYYRKLYIFNDFIATTFCLSGFYILIYVCAKDKIFRMCFLNVFKRKKYDLDDCVCINETEDQAVEA